ncbi:7573_t:CDS:1 [Cetraspora pellucida]|uniref:7573_t:CDS:1 n=1 Tax=Cetraspora pellucida TaxID=1433469 RepID=A0A9N9FM15_9GLOM|nr:7573_t:CDS:1 [Cetraspora pellucida]
MSGLEMDTSNGGAASNSAPPMTAIVFTVLCTASIALVITAAALFFVAHQRMKKDETLESSKVESGYFGRRISFSDSDIAMLKESKESLPMVSPPMPKAETDKKVKPSTPPSTGSATPQSSQHFPQLNSQLFDISPDSFNVPPKAHKSGIISRSRSSIDLAHMKDKEKESDNYPFTEATLYNDSPGPPLGSEQHRVLRIDSEQLGESPSMTTHHPSADYLQEMPSPLRYDYTSPVRSPRTSGDVRPQSRQSSEYMTQPSQEFPERTTHMEPDILHESLQANLGDPYLEYTTRPDRSERSRSRGRSVSPFSDTGTGEHPNPSVSRSSESPSPPPQTERRRPRPGHGGAPEDSVGTPLSPSLSRRGRSSRRQRRGGGGSGTTT